MKEQSTSTSNSSPESSEKDFLRSEDVLALLETPIKSAKVSIKQALEFLLPTKPAQDFATTPREEELYAHILRITKRERGPEVASYMATLLPRPRPLPEAITDVGDAIGKGTQTYQATAPPPMTTKQKRKLRARAEEVDPQQAKDLNLAGDLLCSIPKKEYPTISTSQEPVTTLPQPIGDEEGLDCEFDTMPLRPPRGRPNSESR